MRRAVLSSAVAEMPGAPGLDFETWESTTLHTSGAPSLLRTLQKGWETVPLPGRINSAVAALIVVAGLTFTPSAVGAATGKGVEVIANEADRRVDVTVDGKRFHVVHVAYNAEEAGALSAN